MLSFPWTRRVRKKEILRKIGTKRAFIFIGRLTQMQFIEHIMSKKLFGEFDTYKAHRGQGWATGRLHYELA